MIKIECKANDTLAIEKMKLFQGTLKTRLPEDYVKIQKSIEQYGFSFPFFIWMSSRKMKPIAPPSNFS